MRAGVAAAVVFRPFRRNIGSVARVRWRVLEYGGQPGASCSVARRGNIVVAWREAMLVAGNKNREMRGAQARQKINRQHHYSKRALKLVTSCHQSEAVFYFGGAGVKRLISAINIFSAHIVIGGVR